MLDEENIQPAPEPTQPQPSPEAPADDAEPISTPSVENPISEPNPIPANPQEPIPGAPISPIDSAPSEVSPDAPQASPSPESTVMDKDQNPANEPLEPASTPESTFVPENPNITIEKHGNDVTITEVMEPTAPDVAEAMPDKHPEPATAQMAGNEPLSLESDQTKIRKENLIKANEKRQNKKREKIDKILTLFSEKKEVTNDEVEKLLYVSDATATRYLETLEKEGKIKQVGKTGKGVSYTKI